MKLPVFSSLVTAISWSSSLTVRSFVSAESSILELHGSGTSNPSKCLWSIMASLTEEAGIPVRMTYRSIGSGAGIAEFSDQVQSDPAEDEPKVNRIFFASGDIPIDAETYTNLTLASSSSSPGSPLMHLPIVAGAVSFFHSVPSTEYLNLSACVLAQIFSLEITSWGDEQITALNPHLPPDVKSLPITVARRKDGSSSTSSSTKYMQSACSDPDLRLPDSLVGLQPSWPEIPALLICDGSSGMTKCIQETNGTIGYIDYGHGASAGLQEVRLNISGTFRHSQESVVNAAVTRSNLPATPDLDHSNVTFLNGAGDTTWPIVQMTYLYVRTNLTEYISNPQEQSLLIAFLRSLYNEVYIDRCAKEYGFTVMSNSSLPEIYNYSMAAIDTLAATINPDSVQWVFENKDTLKEIGAGPYVFSGRRHVQLKEISSRLDELELALTGEPALAAEVGDDVNVPPVPDSYAGIKEQLSALRVDLDKLIADKDSHSHSSSDQDSSQKSLDFTSSNQRQINAAVVLSSISFVLWILWVVAYVARCLKVDSSGGGYSN